MDKIDGLSCPLKKNYTTLPSHSPFGKMMFLKDPIVHSRQNSIVNDQQTIIHIPHYSCHLLFCDF